MTEFAHTYSSVADCASKFVPSADVAFTLVNYCADGKVQAVDSNELPSIKTEDGAISAAMFAVSDYDDSCDVYPFGEYCGTAEYVDMTPNSWFDSMQVVFSMPC